MSEDVAFPEVTDGSGYRVTPEDLVYLGISIDSFRAFDARRLPLGFSEILYRAFSTELWKALAADGVSVDWVDVRLQGSSSNFFSGRHKVLPGTRDEILVEYIKLRNKWPQVYQVNDIVDRLEGKWPPANRPSRRPFDSMFQLMIDRVPSDYDLQISSDAIVEKCEDAARRLGMGAIRENAYNSYSFIRKDLLRLAMPTLAHFGDDMSEALRRDVNIAVFGSAGPPDHSADPEAQSSHFQPSDWCICTPNATASRAGQHAA